MKPPGETAAGGARELLGRALDTAFGAARTPFDEPPFLLVRLDDGHAPDGGDSRRLAAWLGSQPCPVIGLGSAEAAPALAAACDLVLADERDLAAVVDNIRRAPLAAMTLVQVLRATCALPPADALAVESLAYGVLQAGPEFRHWSQQNPPAPGRIPTDDGPPVLLDRNGTQLLLRLNRPSSRNAMSIEMRDALVEAFELAALDDAIATIEVGGLGACFCTGGALEEFGTAPDPASAHAIRSIRLPAAALLRSRARKHFHVHGACIGSGIELPAFAERVTASPGAFFQLPEIRFGLIPGAGGCVSLPRRIGRQRTAYLALSARRINAATALAWGLVDAIAPPAAP